MWLELFHFIANLDVFEIFDAQSCRLINNDLISLRAYEISFMLNGRGIIFHAKLARAKRISTALLSVNRGIVITVTMLSIKRNNPCYILRRQRWLNVVKFRIGTTIINLHLLQLLSEYYRVFSGYPIITNVS